MHGNREKKPDLILLGAGGLIGKTFLRFLAPFRRRFGRVVAVDRKPLDVGMRKLLASLDAKEETLDAARPRGLKRLLDAHRGIVVDLSSASTTSVAGTVFGHGGHSYLNTAFNSRSTHLYEPLRRWLGKIPERTRRPHVLFSGMNPGVVNAWAAHGIRKFGTPERIVEFEYDSSALRSAPGRPLLTWSSAHFLAEVVTEPSETVGGRRGIVHHRPSGLFNRRPMREYLFPFTRQRPVPKGALTGHEECLTLSQRFGVEASFLYAVSSPTMRFLARRMRAGRPPTPDDLAQLDNIKLPLIGADHIGLALEYGDRRVTYFCRVANRSVRKAGATTFMVIVGVYAGLFALLSGKLAPRAHFTEDLHGTDYLKFAAENLPTEELVQERRGRRWVTVARSRLRLGKSPSVRLS